MATIIDELVLRFSLDPKGFDQGQRQTLNKLDQLERRANRVGGQVEKSGAGVVGFFRQIEQPIASLRLHMERLATATRAPQRQFGELASQARRTGTSVASGALEGAAGLRVLGAAGLGVFAVFKGLDKLMQAADKNARGIFGTSLGAASAGMNIGQFSAASRALFSKQAVPEADTQSFLSNFAQAKEQALQGNYGPAVALNQALAIAGVQADVFSSTPQQALVAAARRFQSVSEATAVASGQNIGMTPALALGVRREGGGLSATIAAEQRRLTKEQSDAARRFITAENDLSTSFTNLKNKVYDELTPTLISFDGWLKRIIDSFSAIVDPSASHQQKMDAYGGIPGTIEWFRRRLPTWLGGRKPNAETDGGAPSDGVAPQSNNANPSTVGRIRAAIAAAGGNEMAQAGLLSNFYPESIGLNPGAVNPNSGAIGLAQWLGPRKAALYAYAAAHNLDPKSIDAQVGFLEQELRGPYAGVLRQMNAAQNPSSAALIGLTGYEGVNEGNSVTAGAAWPTMVRTHTRLAQSFYNNNRSARGDTNNNVDVGGIHVHTQATTATGIAAAGLMAAKNAALVSQANTGLE